MKFRQVLHPINLESSLCGPTGGSATESTFYRLAGFAVAHRIQFLSTGCPTITDPLGSLAVEHMTVLDARYLAVFRFYSCESVTARI